MTKFCLGWFLFSWIYQFYVKTIHQFFKSETLILLIWIFSITFKNCSLLQSFLIWQLFVNNNYPTLPSSIFAHHLLVHVCLHVFPALSHFEKNGWITCNDDNTWHKETKNHQKFLRRMVIFPANIKNVQSHSCYIINIK